MEFQLKDIFYIIGIVVSALTAFFSVRYGIKEYVRDKCDDLKKEISELKLELKDFEAKDNLQQQVLDQLREQTNGLIPKLIELLDYKTKEDDGTKL